MYNATCRTAGDCGGHGRCTDGACHCFYFWLGSKCETAFGSTNWCVHATHLTSLACSPIRTFGVLTPFHCRRTAWNVFLACVTLLHVFGFLGCMLNLHGFISRSVRWCGRRCGCKRDDVSDTSSASGAPTSFTLRDAALMLCASGCVVRLIWLLDPQGTRFLFVQGAAGFLLRLPQLLWIAAFSIIVLSWSYIMSAISDATVSYRRLRSVLTFFMVCPSHRCAWFPSIYPLLWICAFPFRLLCVASRCPPPLSMPLTAATPHTTSPTSRCRCTASLPCVPLCTPQ